MEQLTLPARIEHLDTLMGFLSAALYSGDLSQSKWSHISLAAEEIFVNIASYAYPGGDGEVTVLAGGDAEQIIIEFRDEGIPFDPVSVTSPDLSLPAISREIGGLGIHLVKKTMDGISYEYRDGRNILTIRKNK